MVIVRVVVRVVRQHEFCYGGCDGVGSSRVDVVEMFVARVTM